MKFHSTRIGEIDVNQDCIVEMPEGMFGFTESRRYAIVPHRKDGPFRWMQSLDNPDLAFLVVDPWLVKPDYAPTISQADARALGLNDDSLRVLYAVVTVPQSNPEGMSCNLLGPVLINTETRTARQVVVLNNSYTTEFSILEGLQAIAEAAPRQSPTCRASATAVGEREHALEHAEMQPAEQAA